MAAIDPKGAETNWVNGVAFQKVTNSNLDNGAESFWVNGCAEQMLLPFSLMGSYFFLF